MTRQRVASPPVVSVVGPHTPHAPGCRCRVSADPGSATTGPLEEQQG